MNGILIFVLVLLVYGAIVLFLYKKKLMERYNLSFFGPAIMWRTKKGREFLDKLSKVKRFWKVYGDLAIVLCITGMVLISAFLLWASALVFSIPKERAPPVEYFIGIPGLNPLIPLWYGIFALVIAIVIHEFSHGILARLAKIKLESLGVLLFVLPIGAFVEPNEEELEKTQKRKRMRLYAAGPASNLILGLLIAMIFSGSVMASLSPARDGVGVLAIASGSPADGKVSVGEIIFSVNGTNVSSYEDFVGVMNQTGAGQTVEFGVFGDSGERYLPITLDDKYNYTQKEEDVGKGFLGVVTRYTFTVWGEMRTYDLKSASSFYDPLSPSGGEFVRSVALYLSLPILGLSPFPSYFDHFYKVGGFWSFMPTSTFLVFANVLYWVFWLNLMLGLTNVLPMVPLDGGYIFRDAFSTLLRKIKRHMKEEVADNYAKNLSNALAVFVLALIIWQVVGPRL